MEERRDEAPRESRSDTRATLMRSLKISLLLFGLLLGGIAVAVSLTGNDTDLPTDYDAFD